MLVSQMWPSKWLDANDLRTLCPQGTVVTIERIDVTFYTNDGGEPEPVYMVYTHQFRKPFRLPKTSGFSLSEMFGTEETEEWAGRAIRIYAIEKKSFDKHTKKPRVSVYIDIDFVPPQGPPTLPSTKQDIAGLYAQQRRLASAQRSAAPMIGDTSGGAMNGIGADTAATIWSALKERGKTFGDFLQHAKTIGADHLVAGKMPHEFPVAAIVPMRAFVGMFPKVAAPATAEQIAQIKASWMPPAPAPQTEVVNRQTGEVITPGQPAAGGVVPGTDIPLDDIPF